MPDRVRWDGVNKCWVQAPAAQATHFRPGEIPNPSGFGNQVTSQNILNAQKASRLRAEMLDALESKIMSAKLRSQPQDGETIPEDGMPVDAANLITGMLRADVNRMLADAEDRAWGKPTQPLRDDSPPKKDIMNDMTPQEAAEAYQAEIEQKSGK